MKHKTHVRKGDTVKVISGNHKGKTGKVLKVFPETNRISVENTETVVRHLKYNKQTKEGGRVTKEGTISLSSVLVLCPKCDAPRRTGIRTLDNGNKVRVCKKCNNDIVYAK